jgi:hypothetical protein
MAAHEADDMTDEQVKATLRTATRQGLIVSWIDLPNGKWTINPNVGRCHDKTWVEIRSYCRMLQRSGVNP